MKSHLETAMTALDTGMMREGVKYLCMHIAEQDKRITQLERMHPKELIYQPDERITFVDGFENEGTGEEDDNFGEMMVSAQVKADEFLNRMNTANAAAIRLQDETDIK